MEMLEKTHGWKEEEFDVVLQYMRTILLKRMAALVLLDLTMANFELLDGASLVYTTPNVSSQLQSLVHSSLGVTSLLKRQPLKHNVIDRDKIVVPPNWDSWGKIRVLREGFDVEVISNGWSIDLDQPFPVSTTNGIENGTSTNGAAEPESVPGSTVALYEGSIQDPSLDALALAGRNNHSTKLEVDTAETQSFLAQQLKVLEAYRQKHEEMQKEEAKTKTFRRPDELDSHLVGGVDEHIGPVQFNMGGIQVDADDMLERIKVSLWCISTIPEESTDVF